MQSWIDCFEKAVLEDTVFAGNVSYEGNLKGQRP